MCSDPPAASQPSEQLPSYRLRDPISSPPAKAPKFYFSSGASCNTHKIRGKEKSDRKPLSGYPSPSHAAGCK